MHTYEVGGQGLAIMVYAFPGQERCFDIGDLLLRGRRRVDGT